MGETVMRDAMQSWLRQSVLVTATFTLVGFLTALGVFSHAPRIWSGSAIAALAAGVGGGLAWALLCGSRSHPVWWRTVLAGVLAGVVVHPIYLLLASTVDGEAIAWSDFLTGSMFLLLIGGIITVPAGVAAAFACRIAGGWWMRSVAKPTGDECRGK